MLDRLRCPICRSVVPITLVWALGDSRPRCSEPLRAARAPRTPRRARERQGRKIAPDAAESARSDAGSGLRAAARIPAETDEREAALWH